MLDFLDFGKNSIYILTCFGVTIAVFWVLIATTLRARYRAKSALAKIENNSK